MNEHLRRRIEEAERALAASGCTCGLPRTNPARRCLIHGDPNSLVAMMAAAVRSTIPPDASSATQESTAEAPAATVRTHRVDGATVTLTLRQQSKPLATLDESRDQR